MFTKRTILNVALMGLILLGAAACTRASGRERGLDAWSERLNAQAQAYQQEQTRADRARGAWTARLTAQARAYQAVQAQVDRALKAYADRLNGLAKELGARE